MIFNLAPRIILTILFHNLENSLIDLFKADSIAISPVQDNRANSAHIHHIFVITTYIKSIPFYVFAENITDEEEGYLSKYFLETIVESENLLQILIKRGYTLQYSHDEDKVINKQEYKSVVISILMSDGEKYLEILMPVQLFRLFSKGIDINSSAQQIEQEMVNFITNPKWIIPDLRSLFTSLSNRELAKLINKLQTMNLLSTYQIFLVTYAFPELSVTIKRVLSKNKISDVLELKKKAGKLKIQKRDIVGGIYSIEESIYFLLRDEVDLRYSSFLRDIQNLIKTARNIEILFFKDFDNWVAEIIEKNLLYQTIAESDDRIIARAIARDTDKYLSIFSQYISNRQILYLRSLIKSTFTHYQILQARINFILKYRSLRIKRLRSDPESLGFLIIRFTKQEDYIHLLLSVGWFILSTAMKGLKRKSIRRILKNIPFAPGFLIEDVLRGVVNPNILHDEIQIRKARMICVDAIIQLYDDGIIDLDE